MGVVVEVGGGWGWGWGVMVNQRQPSTCEGGSISGSMFLPTPWCQSSVEREEMGALPPTPASIDASPLPLGHQGFPHHSTGGDQLRISLLTSNGGNTWELSDNALGGQRCTDFHMAFCMVSQDHSEIIVSENGNVFAGANLIMDSAVYNEQLIK